MDVQLRGCELLWEDVDMADRAQALVEAATGEPCPCATGRRCPLLPREVTLPTPRARAQEPPRSAA